MKICILTPRFPFPECGGDLLRINYIARYLKSRGHQLILVSYTDESPDMETARKLYDKVYTIKRSKWKSLFYSALFLLKGKPIQCGYYFSKGYEKLFHEVVKKEQADLYVSHLLRMVPFTDKEQLQDKTIVEMTDALSKTYALSSNGKGNHLLRNVYKIEKNLIAKYEQYVIEKYAKVVLVSQADITFLEENNHKTYPTLSLHTNGVECMQTVSNEYTPNKICFIGHMQSLQNQDAAIHFVNDIFPLILQKKPDIKFHIVGAHPPLSIQKLDNGKNIFVTGFVDDLIDYISDSCLVVAPVRIAAGIQNKVLVAMGCGIPVVLTPLIAKSIPELTDNENCYIKDDPQSFANSCIALLDDPKTRRLMAEKAHAIAIRNYSWEEKLRGYEDL